MKKKVIIALSTLLGIGLVPFCPGTAASFVGLLFVWIIKDQAVFFAFSLFFLGLAFFFSGKAEVILAEKDAKQIVIDEFAGLLVAFLFVPRDFVFIVVGFILFRLFDIIKIPPANKLEKKSGSLAVVGDDLVAGIYTNLFLQLLRLLLKSSS